MSRGVGLAESLGGRGKFGQTDIRSSGALAAPRFTDPVVIRSGPFAQPATNATITRAMAVEANPNPLDFGPQSVNIRLSLQSDAQRPRGPADWIEEYSVNPNGELRRDPGAPQKGSFPKMPVTLVTHKGRHARPIRFVLPGGLEYAGLDARAISWARDNAFSAQEGQVLLLPGADGGVEARAVWRCRLPLGLHAAGGGAAGAYPARGRMVRRR